MQLRLYPFTQPVIKLLLLFHLLLALVCADVLQLDKGNIEEALRGREMVIVNFYADWCRFSQNLKPVFVDASDKLKDTPQVLFAAVNCEQEPEIAANYHVNKYPTIKLFRYGELIKKEYRGQRSVEAISEHVRKQLESIIQTFVSRDDLNTRIDQSKRNMIAYFAPQQANAMQHFHKVASALRDDCAFWMANGDWVREVVGAEQAIDFRAPHAGPHEDFRYTGPMDNFDNMKTWLADKCVPLVREITFENAEELTEEGIPFLILFRSVGDTHAEQLFNSVITAELADQKSAVNFLMADGKKFAHPLHHLGKSEHDLPLIAIDSFRHMYLFPEFKQISERGKLRQFVLDLHSGKLHREFHQGPDPTQASPADPTQKVGDTQPPPSVFKQLKPAENRYSLLEKTEL